MSFIAAYPAAPTGNNAILVRRYHPSDYPSVVNITKNVYNGTDYLPRIVNRLHEDPETVVLVSHEANEDINGIICGRKAGSIWFIMGLRVHEAARGRGLGHLLTAQVCQAGAQTAGVQHLVTATIPQNPSAVAIFEHLNFQHTHTVDIWPSYEAQKMYEQSVGFVPGQPWDSHGHPGLLDAVPGARQAVSEAASSVGVRPSCWVQCSSQEQLEQAVSSIRQQQAQYADIKQSPCDGPGNWLPWVYEPWPADAVWTQERLDSGKVWLLPRQQHCRSPGQEFCSSQNGIISTSDSSSGDSSSSSCPNNQGQQGLEGSNLHQSTTGSEQYHAVLVLAQSEEFRRVAAGMLTAQDAYAAAAIELAATKEPYFIAFCDRGTKHSSGKVDVHVVLPDFSMITGAPACYIVYSRRASTWPVDISMQVAQN